jgi:GTP cyclohydrolase III
MPRMTDEQRKAYEDLKKLAAEEERELQAVEKEKEEAEKAKQAALAAGDKTGAKKAEATVIASESSIQNLNDKLDRVFAEIDALAEAKGPEAKARVQEVRTRFLRKTT